MFSVSGPETWVTECTGYIGIAADVAWQSALLKKPFKHGKSIIFFSGRESFAAEQITAGMIGENE